MIEYAGGYHWAGGASMIFGAATGSSREHVGRHVVGTVVGAAAMAYNAQHMVESEKNVAGMCGKLALYGLWLMGWVTTTNRNIDKEDTKEVEKRLKENKPEAKEIEQLKKELSQFLVRPLVTCDKETTEVRTLIIKCDAMIAEVAECVGADKARLASFKKRFRSRRDGKRK